MKKQELLRRILTVLVCAAVFTALAGLGLWNRPDATLSDMLYQHERATDGEIVVIGMDNRASDVLGPMPWPRSVMAEAIEYLNNADPDSRPAVIGIDVLYVGNSADPDADAYLAEAAEDGGNVVVASAAYFGSQLVDNGGSDFYMDTDAVLAMDRPYPELAAAAGTGHINAMTDDTDGVIRHARLFIRDDQGQRLDAFSRVIYERWCEATGQEIIPAPETTEQGYWYLPFTASGGSYYDGVSIVDLLDGEVDPDYYADKIVLIGPYAPGMQDEYRTAIDHNAPMYGIEINANQIDAYRRGFFPQEIGNTLQLALLFVICAVVLWILYDRHVLSALAIWLGVCVLWVAACLLCYRGGRILHVLWVPLSVTVLFIGSVAVNYIRASREKRRVTNTFGHYVDPAVMNQLLEQGESALELGGKLYDIAVLFVDIRGFTTMSENLDPPTVVEIINSYLTLTTECIMRHHGTLDKFVGDCTMAFWNAPLPQEDPIYLACCAAMDMVEGSKALGRQLQERFGRSVSFGVGVHYGPAVVGNIGAPKRMDYTAIGDTVNTAARLEANAPGGTVYISRAVADILGDRARTTSLGGAIKLKGKADGFEILTLDELRD